MHHNKWFLYLILMKTINHKNNLSLECLKNIKKVLSYQQDNNFLFKLFLLNNNFPILLLFKQYLLNKESKIMFFPNSKRKWMTLLKMYHYIKKTIKKMIKNLIKNLVHKLKVFWNQMSLKILIKKELNFKLLLKIYKRKHRKIEIIYIL